MRFLTMVKMNSNVVSKGYGPNKREAKIAAVESLLSIICPKIFQEFKDKLKSHAFKTNPNQVSKIEQQNWEMSLRQQSTQPDTEMVIEYTSDNSGSQESNEKENPKRSGELHQIGHVPFAPNQTENLIN
jgi:hypothetical protein